MKTDTEIFDTLNIPDDRRPEVSALLHAWAKSNMPGPHAYAVQAAVIWALIGRAEWTGEQQ